MQMILVSACLAGINCRYGGGSCEDAAIKAMVQQGKAIPVCPEILGGLDVPRPACELIRAADGSVRVVSKDGRDLTAAMVRGAKKTLAVAKALGVAKVIVKSRSPSCGYGLIYDGTFTGKLVSGNGLAVELLLKNKIKVYTENDFSREDLIQFQKD
jgi:uncharacterized protein YbbK (DUF523 family)